VDWKDIPDFPGYSVHFTGTIRNERTYRPMAVQINQHGTVYVGMVIDGQQYKRSVALIVARAFLPPPEPVTFDTPIHLDGDQTNNHVENLMWRPYWFAIRYQRQFRNEMSVPEQIQDVRTGERYNNSMHAATTFGLLDREIYQSMTNRTYVWPTYQEFRIVRKNGA
jgi:hypothetical protein